MRTWLRSILLVVVALSVASCSAGFMMRRYRLATTPESATAVDKEAMRLEVTPITLAEAGDVGDLNVQFANDKVKFAWAIAGAPVFHLGITNKGNDSVKIAATDIKVTDAKGTSYGLLDAAGVKARNTANINRSAQKARENGSGGDEESTQQLIAMCDAQIAKLNLAEGTLEVPAAATASYYLIFDFPAESQTDNKSNTDWVMANAPLKLTLANVSAGAAVESIELPFVASPWEDRYDGNMKKITATK